MLKIFICAQFLVCFLPETALKSIANEPSLRAFVFLGTDCPISQDYVGVLNEMDNKYQGEVEFVGVIPEEIAAREVNVFRKEYQVKFDLQVDKNLALVEKYGIQTTPEVVLLDESDDVQYQGAIDNWYYALGKHRQSPTEYYLKEAIDALLSGKAVGVKKSETVGCVINRMSHQH